MNRDLLYIGIIGLLGYYLLNKKSESRNVNTSNANVPPAGNASNGGLNLPSNMDLPNLTPTPANGLPTEVALNNGYITPIVKDEEPEQIFGVSLPSNITSPSQIQEILDVSEAPSENAPTPMTSTTPILSSQDGAPIETITNVGNSPSQNTGGSIISEPILPIKNLEAEIATESPIGISEPRVSNVATDIVAKCGSSFSIPNNDKEGSYTNFWYDGKDFYTQSTSPLIRSIAVKITTDLYLDACKKYQLLQIQNAQS